MKDPSESSESEETAPEPPRGKIVPFPGRRSTQPDWLTRPGDELDSGNPGGADELPRETLEPALPMPVLIRPGARPPAPAPQPRDASAWAGPYSDMARVPATPAPSPEPASDPPAGEPSIEDEEAGDPAGLGAAPGAWAPAGSSVPVIRTPLPDQVPVEKARADRIAPPIPLPVAGSVPVLAPATPPAPLQEPFWLIALDGLRTNRALQALAAVVVVALAVLAWAFFPRGIGLTPLSRLRHDPSRFDGTIVSVRGRVGDDVFTVGSGWAFYLTQGRDTVVAFARTRSPSPHAVITFHGQVSTGFLDGVARQALFETDPTK